MPNISEQKTMLVCLFWSSDRWKAGEKALEPVGNPRLRVVDGGGRRWAIVPAAI
jgi:hypothetical protein